MNCFGGRTFLAWTASFLVAVLVACSTPADSSVEENDDDVPGSVVTRPKSSSSVERSCSSEAPESSSAVAEDPMKVLESLVTLVNVPKQELNRDKTVMSVSSFSISRTEVTQVLYKTVMGELPDVLKIGDSIAVANVNWFEAVLFCNALSKRAGLDTAYVYEEIGQSRYLKNLTVNYDVKAVRLPTETEWEIACRGGTSTTYYWDVAVASKYAYYAQTKTNGPTEVGQYLPNAFGLYDMSGNVAEWTNDWYGDYPVRSTKDYRGPEEGERRVVRGGSWSDKAPALASAEREKKDPLYQSHMVGFRISIMR